MQEEELKDSIARMCIIFLIIILKWFSVHDATLSCDIRTSKVSNKLPDPLM